MHRIAASRPWRRVDAAPVPGGGELLLLERDGRWAIRVDGRELMDSGGHASEERLAVLACAAIEGAAAPRVLVGGLGMGFTLAAALRVLPDDARVVVVELLPAVVRWNRGPLGELAGSPLEDPRVSACVADIVDVLSRAAASSHDAILLDVDNGPGHACRPRNLVLYGVDGVMRAARLLRPGGVLGAWSAEEAPDLARAMERAGLSVEVEHAAALPGGRGPRHVLYIGRRAASREGSAPRG